MAHKEDEHAQFEAVPGLPNESKGAAQRDLVAVCTAGRDLAGMLHGEPGDANRVGVTEFAWSKSIRKGRYRLVHYPPEAFADEYPQGFGELYDLEKDPHEIHNLADEHGTTIDPADVGMPPEH